MLKKIDYVNYKKPSDFLKFEQGDNQIRIVSSGGLGMFHGMRAGGRYIPLGLCSEKEDCEHCNNGNEPKRIWRWLAYDYSGKEVKLLDAGPQIGDAICNIAKKKKQDPQEYDLIINRKGLDRKTKYEVRLASKSKKIDEDLTAHKKYLIRKYFK